MPIGFFDSGVGGLSVLKEAIKIMPNENYIYYGDSINAPYGVRKVEDIRELTFNAIKVLLDKGVKGIVVACNTATSAAVADLRVEYPNIPLVGIEPAIKPAVEISKDGEILIMATPMTLEQNKFNFLMNKYKEDASIIPVPCAGLAEFIESGILNGIELENYLKEKLNPYMKKSISAIVLGCTHYPFIKEALGNVVGKEVIILDGGLGTAREIKRRLEEKDLLTDSTKKGNVKVYNSLNTKEILDLSYKLIET